MSNSRQKILNYILEQQSSTVEEISKVFNVTPANIRHHLAILTEQGSVTVIGQVESSRRGRPCQIYAMKQHIDQNNLNKLSDALLCTVLCDTKPDELNRFIEKIAKQLAAEFNTDIINPTRRLYSTIHALNKMNYNAHWEAHLINPRIMLGHCPYRSILEEHPELCQMDTRLLEQLLNTQVRQIEKQKINTKGLAQCIFLINNRA